METNVNVTLNALHVLGGAAALLVILLAGICAAKKVLSAFDFSVSSRSAGPFLVMGTILGTLVGGASTVGTAQMAYLYGFSAWWFTLGGGIGCLLIALFFAGPMHKTRFETIPRFISANYGLAAGVIAAVFVSLGLFINIIPQIFSSMALLTAVFSIDLKLAAVIAVILVVLYVVFGGMWSTGIIGLSKIILTGLGMLTAGLVALALSGGPEGISTYFPSFPWFSLFGRGVNNDLAASFALIVGVLSSQIYFQGVFSGRDLPAARKGALLSAIIAPLIGLGGILVGLFMRIHYPEINPSQVLPMFIINYLPAWFAGFVLTTLLVASIGTGAGLTLGVSTMLNRDIYLQIHAPVDDHRILIVFRLLIVAIMVLALGVVLITGSDFLILNWSYLSLGLRGATIFFPLLSVIFMPGKISARAGTLAVLAGPVIVIVGSLIPFSINPLYPGLLAGLIILFAGYLDKRYQK